jgi:hypothetical protein
MKTDSSTAAKLAGLNISDRNILGLKRAKKYIESSPDQKRTSLR